MFSDYIDLQQQNMIKDLMRLVSVPSVATSGDKNFPFGKHVNDALSVITDIASEMGFKAKNLGTCAEISFGKTKGEKVYIAGHVDVVPPGDGWTSPPYELTIRNGKMYGRGVLDDKGPSIAALYALKALKELGYKPKAQIKLILGGNEENGMTDLADYIDKYGLPDYAITPDSSFPIINAEAGVLQGKFENFEIKESGDLRLLSFNGGNAVNAVPDICRAVLKVPKEKQSEVKTVLAARSYKKTDVEFYFDNDSLCLTVYGLSAHGSVPEKGENACIKAAEILSQLPFENSYFSALTDLFTDDTEGKKLGIACADDILGKLSVNVGVCDYEADKKSVIALDIRLPIKASAEDVENKLSAAATACGAKYIKDELLESTFVPSDTEFLQKLAACYEEITGKKADFVAARGATYAKCFKGKGVAFGPIDEEDPEEGGNMHSADEYLSVKAFLDLAKIYALSIYKLWVK